MTGIIRGMRIRRQMKKDEPKWKKIEEDTKTYLNKKKGGK